MKNFILGAILMVALLFFMLGVMTIVKLGGIQETITFVRSKNAQPRHLFQAGLSVTTDLNSKDIKRLLCLQSTKYKVNIEPGKYNMTTWFEIWTHKSDKPTIQPKGSSLYEVDGTKPCEWVVGLPSDKNRTIAFLREDGGTVYTYENLKLEGSESSYHRNNMYASLRVKPGKNILLGIVKISDEMNPGHTCNETEIRKKVEKLRAENRKFRYVVFKANLVRGNGELKSLTPVWENGEVVLKKIE